MKTRSECIERLVAQRLALNERLPHVFCWFCRRKLECLDGGPQGPCPLELKEVKPL